MVKSKSKLTVWIGGREALPVRAIPYVTGWQRLPPDAVAACLAGATDFFMRARLTAYRISGDEPIQITPRQWDAVVVKLKGLAAKLRRQHGNDEIGDDIGYDAWRSGAVKILPADAFVWLDELETEYQADRKSQFYYETRPSDDELILEPMLDADTIAMVMKGFEKYLSEEQTGEEQAGFDYGYYRAVARDVGSVGNWDYWASQKYLEPREVACLMFELDPKHFDEIHSNRNTLLQPGALADEIDKVERSATRDTEGANLSSAEWIEWSQSKGYAVPDKFVQAVAEVARKAQGGAQESDVIIQAKQAPSDDNPENFSQYANWFIPLNTKGLAATFKVKIDSEDRETKKRGTENLKWWEARINEAYRLPLLLAAKENRGRYNPAKVADYLVNAGNLNAGQCRRILQNNVIEKNRDDAIAVWGENLT